LADLSRRCHAPVTFLGHEKAHRAVGFFALFSSSNPDVSMIFDHGDIGMCSLGG
jgi:hypothetical protein